MGHIRPPRPDTLDRFERVASDAVRREQTRKEVAYLLHDFWLEQEEKERKSNASNNQISPIHTNLETQITALADTTNIA